MDDPQHQWQGLSDDHGTDDLFQQLFDDLVCLRSTSSILFSIQESASLKPEQIGQPMLETTGFFEDAWRRLRSNRAAMFALWTLASFSSWRSSALLISPYSYSEIHLELKNTHPVLEILVRKR